jgi:hypothetical protein
MVNFYALHSDYEPTVLHTMGPRLALPLAFIILRRTRATLRIYDLATGRMDWRVAQVTDCGSVSCVRPEGWLLANFCRYSLEVVLPLIPTAYRTFESLHQSVVDHGSSISGAFDLASSESLELLRPTRTKWSEAHELRNNGVGRGRRLTERHPRCGW